MNVNGLKTDFFEIFRIRVGQSTLWCLTRLRDNRKTVSKEPYPEEPDSSLLKSKEWLHFVAPLSSDNIFHKNKRHSSLFLEDAE